MIWAFQSDTHTHVYDARFSWKQPLNHAHWRRSFLKLSYVEQSSLN